MKAFIEPLQELSGYEDMTKAAMQPGLVTISGCIDAQKPHTAERISALRAIHENEQVTVITTFDALMNTMPRDAQVWDSVLHIAQGDTLDLDALVEQLVRMGYERQYQVDGRKSGPD